MYSLIFPNIDPGF